MVEAVDLARLFGDLRRAIQEATPAIPALLTAEQAAKRLGMADKVFRQAVRDRKIRWIMVGRRRKYTESDLAEFIANQRGATPCPSTSQKPRRSGTTTSSSKVYDITAARAKRPKPRRER